METVQLLNSSKVNARTTANLREVERLAGVNLTVIKGQKISPGDSSAGTHDGYGVVDLRTAGWSAVTRERVLTAARETGNAAWYRTVAQGFDGPHIHAVLMGEPDLSPAARRQVTAYRNGHNGLANNGPDDGPKGYTGVTWESYLKAHQPEDDMPYTEAQIKQMVQDELEEYNKRFWVAPTGTGTALREDVAQIKEAVLGK
jgi:hypothetical protein